MNREELLDYTYFVVKHIERGVTPAWLVDKYMNKPSPSSATAEEIKTVEEFWEEKEADMIKTIGLEMMKSDKLYLPYELWAFAKEFAALAVAEATKDCYPKRFLLWAHIQDYWLFDPLTCLWHSDEPEAFQEEKTTDELCEYWKENEK